MKPAPHYVHPTGRLGFMVLGDPTIHRDEDEAIAAAEQLMEETGQTQLAITEVLTHLVLVK